MNTFNKVWIVPEKAVVYENAKAGTAYVVESKLKVMLEADYLSLEKNTVGAPLAGAQTIGAGVPSYRGFPLVASPARTDVNQIGSQIVREIVIPELTKEINEGANFAQLRQVYSSLILATWYKKKIKDSILSKVYADRNKIQGVQYRTDDRPVVSTEQIYQQYLTAFKKGVYNYIKEDIDPLTQERTPRKYFSGGATFDPAALAEAWRTTDHIDPAQLAHPGDLAMISIRIERTDGSQNGFAKREFSLGRYLTLSVKLENSEVYGVHIDRNIQELQLRRSIALRLIIKDVLEALTEILTDKEGRYDTITHLEFRSPMLIQVERDSVRFAKPIENLLKFLGITGEIRPFDINDKIAFFLEKSGSLFSIRAFRQWWTLYQKKNVGVFTMDISSAEKKRELAEKLSAYDQAMISASLEAADSANTDQPELNGQIAQLMNIKKKSRENWIDLFGLVKQKLELGDKYPTVAQVAAQLGLTEGQVFSTIAHFFPNATSYNEFGVEDRRGSKEINIEKVRKAVDALKIRKAAATFRSVMAEAGLTQPTMSRIGRTTLEELGVVFENNKGEAYVQGKVAQVEALVAQKGEVTYADLPSNLRTLRSAVLTKLGVSTEEARTLQRKANIREGIIWILKSAGIENPTYERLAEVLGPNELNLEEIEPRALKAWGFRHTDNFMFEETLSNHRRIAVLEDWDLITDENDLFDEVTSKFFMQWVKLNRLKRTIAARFGVPSDWAGALLVRLLYEKPDSHGVQAKELIAKDLEELKEFADEMTPEIQVAFEDLIEMRRKYLWSSFSSEMDYLVERLTRSKNTSVRLKKFAAVKILELATEFKFNSERYVAKELEAGEPGREYDSAKKREVVLAIKSLAKGVADQAMAAEAADSQISVVMTKERKSLADWEDLFRLSRIKLNIPADGLMTIEQMMQVTGLKSAAIRNFISKNGKTYEELGLKKMQGDREGKMQAVREAVARLKAAGRDVTFSHVQQETGIQQSTLSYLLKDNADEVTALGIIYENTSGIRQQNIAEIKALVASHPGITSGELPEHLARMDAKTLQSLGVVVRDVKRAKRREVIVKAVIQMLRDQQEPSVVGLYKIFREESKEEISLQSFESWLRLNNKYFIWNAHHEASATWRFLVNNRFITSERAVLKGDPDGFLNQSRRLVQLRDAVAKRFSLSSELSTEVVGRLLIRMTFSQVPEYKQRLTTSLWQLVLRDLVTKEAADLNKAGYDLVGMDIGKPENASYYIKAQGQTYVWSDLNLPDDEYTGVIVSSSVSSHYFEFTVEFTKGEEKLRRTFQITERKIKGVNPKVVFAQEFSKGDDHTRRSVEFNQREAGEVLSIDRKAGQRALTQIMKNEPLIYTDVKGLLIGKIDAQGRINLTIAPEFSIQLNVLGFRDKGWQGRIVELSSLADRKVLEMEFFKEGKPSVRRKFWIGPEQSHIQLADSEVKFSVFKPALFETRFERENLLVKARELIETKKRGVLLQFLRTQASLDEFSGLRKKSMWEIESGRENMGAESYAHIEKALMDAYAKDDRVKPEEVQGMIKEAFESRIREIERARMIKKQATQKRREERRKALQRTDLTNEERARLGLEQYLSGMDHLSDDDAQELWVAKDKESLNFGLTFLIQEVIQDLGNRYQVTMYAQSFSAGAQVLNEAIEEYDPLLHGPLLTSYIRKQLKDRIPKVVADEEKSTSPDRTSLDAARYNDEGDSRELGEEVAAPAITNHRTLDDLLKRLQIVEEKIQQYMDGLNGQVVHLNQKQQKADRLLANPPVAAVINYLQERQIGFAAYLSGQWGNLAFTKADEVVDMTILLETSLSRFEEVITQFSGQWQQKNVSEENGVTTVEFDLDGQIVRLHLATSLNNEAYQEDAIMDVFSNGILVKESSGTLNVVRERIFQGLGEDATEYIFDYYMKLMVQQREILEKISIDAAMTSQIDPMMQLKKAYQSEGETTIDITEWLGKNGQNSGAMRRAFLLPNGQVWGNDDSLKIGKKLTQIQLIVTKKGKGITLTFVGYRGKEENSRSQWLWNEGEAKFIYQEKQRTLDEVGETKEALKQIFFNVKNNKHWLLYEALLKSLIGKKLGATKRGVLSLSLLPRYEYLLPLAGAKKYDDYQVTIADVKVWDHLVEFTFRFDKEISDERGQQKIDSFERTLQLGKYTRFITKHKGDPAVDQDLESVLISARLGILGLAELVQKPVDFNWKEHEAELPNLAHMLVGETSKKGSISFPAVGGEGFEYHWTAIGEIKEGYQGRVISQQAFVNRFEFTVRYTKELVDDSGTKRIDSFDILYQIGRFQKEVEHFEGVGKRNFLEMSDELATIAINEMIVMSPGQIKDANYNLDGLKFRKTKKDGMAYINVKDEIAGDYIKIDWRMLDIEDGEGWQGTVMTSTAHDDYFEFQVEFEKEGKKLAPITYQLRPGKKKTLDIIVVGREPKKRGGWKPRVFLSGEKLFAKADQLRLEGKKGVSLRLLRRQAKLSHIEGISTHAMLQIENGRKLMNKEAFELISTSLRNVYLKDNRLTKVQLDQLLHAAFDEDIRKSDDIQRQLLLLKQQQDQLKQEEKLRKEKERNRPVLSSTERLVASINKTKVIDADEVQLFWKGGRRVDLYSGIMYLVAQYVKEDLDYIYAETLFPQSFSAASSIVLSRILGLPSDQTIPVVINEYDPERHGASLLDYVRQQIKLHVPSIVNLENKWTAPTSLQAPIGGSSEDSDDMTLEGVVADERHVVEAKGDFEEFQMRLNTVQQVILDQTSQLNGKTVHPDRKQVFVDQIRDDWRSKGVFELLDHQKTAYGVYFSGLWGQWSFTQYDDLMEITIAVNQSHDGLTELVKELSSTLGGQIYQNNGAKRIGYSYQGRQIMINLIGSIGFEEDEMDCILDIFANDVLIHESKVGIIKLIAQQIFKRLGDKASEEIMGYYHELSDALGVRLQDLQSKDSAQLSSKGGIDFNANKLILETRREGGEIKMNIDPRMLLQFQNASGFVPVIINILPMTDLKGFLGLNEAGYQLTNTGTA